jgi:flavin-binding protein dodecin
MEANEKMALLKRDLDSTLSRCIRPEQSTKAIEKLEKEAKEVSETLTRKITKANTRIKELYKGKEKDVDPTSLPEKFDPTNALEHLNNPDFVEKTAKTIKTEIEAQIIKCKRQGGQKQKKADADNKLKDVKAKIEAARAKVLAKREKVDALRVEREQSRKRLLEVTQLTKVKKVIEGIPASPEAITAAAKRAAAKAAKGRVDLALQTRGIREARIEELKERMALLGVKAEEYKGRREQI